MPRTRLDARDRRASMIAVLDIGKSNVKLIAFDGELDVRAERAIANRPVPGPPYPHADVGAIWTFLLEGLTAFAPLGLTDIIVTTHGAAAALVDTRAGGDGLALPILDYEFSGPEDIEPDYARRRPPFTETRSPPLGAGLNLGRQLAYLIARHPEGVARANALVMYPQYWAWRLSGVAAAEATSLGCHTDLWCPATGRPSSLLANLGLSDILPPLAGAGDVLGPLDVGIATRLGVSPAVRVRCGIHDSNAALTPHLLAQEPPFFVVSTGTWVVIFAIGGSCDGLDPAMDMLANVDVFGRAVPCARFMGGREFAALAGEGAAEAGETDLARLVATGTMALPAFSPVGGRFAGLAGHIEGPPPICPAECAALAALYTALLTEEALRRLGAAGGRIIIEGPFARNDAYLGALAALLPDATVLAARQESGTALGAAALCLGRHRKAKTSLRPVAPARMAGLASYALRWRERIIDR